MNHFILTILAVALYAFASVRLLLNLFRQNGTTSTAANANASANSSEAALAGAAIAKVSAPSNVSVRGPNRRASLLAATVALALHVFVAFQQAGLPQALSLPFFTALSVMGATIVVIQLLMCVWQPADYLGLAVYPIAGLSMLASTSGSPTTANLPPEIQMHVLLSIIAYAVLALCAAQAVLVTVQRRYLLQHKPGGFIRLLPPLTQMESLLFILLFAGFFLLSLSLLSGFFYLEDMFAQHLVHKTVLSCLAWLIFALLLLGRWLFGWRGKKAVYWVLGGFALLLLAYFGTKLVLELILQRT